MLFEEILNQLKGLLQRQGRVSFRAVKRQFDISDEYVSDLVYELVNVQNIAFLEDEEILVFNLESQKKVIQKTTAERRQLTVMFVDLVGSVALSQKLDPEDLADILYAYQDTFDGIVNRFGGSVVQLLGDGIMSYFGYPEAREDDPRRAVMAGVEMLNKLSVLNTEIIQKYGIELKIRIGVHTGLVVIGTAGGKGYTETLALGEAPNLAARVQGAAEPNTMYVSSVTQKLVDSHFIMASSGKHQLKGLNDAMELFQVLGEKKMEAQWHESVRYSTPFVGRNLEQNRIKECWEKANNGLGQIVLISGEAGIGKSRLIRSVVGEIKNKKTPIFNFNGSSYHQNSSFQPVFSRLRKSIFSKAIADTNPLFEELKYFFEEWPHTQTNDLVICAEFLNISLPYEEMAVEMAGEKKKVLMLDLLCRWILNSEAPSIIIFEDLHWMDPSTLELFDLITQRINETNTLCLATFRPEFTPHWPYQNNICELALTRLSKLESEEMLAYVVDQIPVELVKNVLAKTDGNPLFIEEVTKLVLETADTKNDNPGFEATTIEIPNTLQDSLMARLDRLGEAKEVAQIGATIGRNFGGQLLQSLVDDSAEILEKKIQQLIDAQIIFSIGKFPNANYTFKHALTQETAYASLLKKRRRKIHKKIVDSVESNPRELAVYPLARIAYHCKRAKLWEKSITYWHKAGAADIMQSGHKEAIINLNEGLEALATLSDSDQKDEQEVAIQLALGAALTALRGYGADEVQAAYKRAKLLCQKLGDLSTMVPATYGLWRYHLLRANYSDAEKLSQEMLKYTRNSENIMHRQMAHRAAGSTYFYIGNFDLAKEYLEKVIEEEITEKIHEESLIYDVVDMWVTAYSYLSWTHWMFGEYDQALQSSWNAIDLAQRLNHPFSIALANCFAAWLHQFMGEIDSVVETAKEGLILAEDYGFTFWIGWAQFLMAWVNDVRTEKNNVVDMQAGFNTWLSTGSALGTTYFMVLEAERLIKYGEAEKANNKIQKAYEFCEATNENWWLAEIYRVHGKWHQRFSRNAEESIELFKKALTLAEKQNAISLVARAKIELGNVEKNEVGGTKGARR